jgi:hypothetical protein
VFIRARYWTLFCSRLTRNTLIAPYFFKPHFNIIPHLQLSLASGVFLSGILIKILHAFLVSPERAIIVLYLKKFDDQGQ